MLFVYINVIMICECKSKAFYLHLIYKHDILTIALYRYHAWRCNRYHAITAICTACIAASGTKISVLLFNLQR